MADHGRPPKHTPSEDPCYLWARSLDPYVCFVGAFLWQVVIVITRRMVGALGTIAGSRVLDSDDDEGSGTSRFVSDVRSYRPVDKHWRRILCTGNHAGLDHGVGHFRLLSITQQRHYGIAMSHEDLCQVFRQFSFATTRCISSIYKRIFISIAYKKSKKIK